jgi:hypothetical protein
MAMTFDDIRRSNTSNTIPLYGDTVINKKS